MSQIDLNGLSTEKRNPETMNLDEMEIEDILAVMNREDEKVVRIVGGVLPKVAEIIGFTTESLKRNGRIIYIGAGTSGRLGVLDAAECPPTFGVSSEVVVGVIAGGERAFLKAVEGAEDNEALGAEDLKELGVDERYGNRSYRQRENALCNRSVKVRCRERMQNGLHFL